MQHGRCIGTAVSSVRPPTFHPRALVLHTHQHRLDNATGGAWFPTSIHGGSNRSCWSVVGRQRRTLQRERPPPFLLVHPLPSTRRSTARLLGSRKLAYGLANWSSSCFNGGGGVSEAVAVTEILKDLGAACFSLGGAYCLVLTFDNLTKRRLVEQTLSRKLVHVLSGVLFLLTWPMFSSSPEARFFAAVVPLLNFLRLLAYGLAVVKDEALIKSVTRYGRREELLRGPLYYVIALLLAVVFFWRDSPVGLVALCMMSGGDGFADIVGRRFGSAKLPFNKQKSWAGSVSMFIFGSAISLGMLYYYWALGFLPSLDWNGGSVALKVALVALTATAVESLPLTDSVDDNVSVPLSSILAGMVVFGP